ncbi:putative aminotransferase family protein (LolT) [Aspergillus fijiensis CBS 313.89]|uniref:Putative aminotransferase n=1 Tax=Aspergillus fijiensis CBS 313.89 TaxID=1448319 RepID=A0A8G1RQ64_9EURO|nr:putative aminotransferase [Aspergillus fijiensis CBS 313.89]RAK76617.1 putative aminotransferase [Aspergillus fijiensis CBS 313.89]
MSPTTPFGASMRQHFLLDPNYRNLNHGSFGTHPRPVLATQQTYQRLAELSPDQFLRYTQPTALLPARHALAALLNCPVRDLVPVKNATTGVATVLHNLAPHFVEGDTLLYFSTVYGAVENGLFSLRDHLPGPTLRLRKIEYAFPITPAELVQRFREAVRQVRAEGSRPRIAVLETVVSLPGVRFPFEILVKVCREEGVWSLVDAAHGVGMIELDLGTALVDEGRDGGQDGLGDDGLGLGPGPDGWGKIGGVDFLTSNCHKWLYTPRSVALLYVNPALQHLIRTTLPTSWGYIPPPSETPAKPSLMASAGRKTAFEALFEFVATADDTPYLCVPAALQFREEVCGGEAAVYAYLEELVNEGADLVAAGLGTEVLGDGNAAGKRSAWRRCAMNNVRLPVRVVQTVRGEEDTAGLTAELVPAVVDWMQRRLVEDYRTFVPVFAHAGWLWVRLSAQVYLDRSDFEWLVPVLKELVGRVKKEFKLGKVSSHL